MPPRKRNESELGKMFRSYNMHARKARDSGYIHCPVCHRPVTNCPMCHGHMLMPKAEKLPDFVVSIEYVYVEAKEGGDRWPFVDSITSIQRQVMVEHESWLFLEMGTGNAPHGREAYLIPWEAWLLAETGLIDAGFKSIVYEKKGKVPAARDLFSHYAMEWEAKDGWRIPNDHGFWKRHSRVKVINSRSATN